METKNKVLMKYLYRRERREKGVALEKLVEWTKNGRYQHRIEAVRGLRQIPMEGGMVYGQVAAEELPRILPAMDEKGGYTGLVLLSFRIQEGYETLERLRQKVNLWDQTLL